MRTYAFCLQFLSAVAATILVAGPAAQLLHKKQDKEEQEQIADVELRGKNKEEVTEYAAGHQPQEVTYGRRRSELPE